MKECRVCNVTKNLTEFSKRADYKDGYFTRCKQCDSESHKKRMERKGELILNQKKLHRERNKAKLSAQKKEWYCKNKEHCKAKSKKNRQNNKARCQKLQKEYYSKNKSKIRATNKKWAARNRGKCNSYKAKYKSTKIQATPPWLTYEHLAEIEELYQWAKDLQWLNNGEPLHVDHIIPLQGVDVCGLHVPWNLRIIPASENCKKSNTKYHKKSIVFKIEEVRNS